MPAFDTVAYEEGWIAYGNNEPRTNNPHVDTIWEKDWYRGWDTAKRVEEG